MWYTPLQKNKTKSLKNKMWPLSGRNNGNNPGTSNRDSLTVEIDPEAKVPTEEIPTTGQHRPRAPTLPEMVNSVSTAKS
jgi:hypothetical protein